MRITLRQLEVFRAVCYSGTVTAAGPTVGLSQAAASQALAEFENLLERKVFDRLGKKLILNSEGKRLLPVAIEVLDRVREIEAPEHEATPTLRLGASLTAGSYLLPDHLARFCRAHPDYQLQVQIANTEQVVNGLLRFDFDAGWVEGFVRHADLRSERWVQDELVVVCSPVHALAGRMVTLKDLKDETWILREHGSGTREVFERAVEGKLPLHRTIEISGIEAVKRMVIAKGGIACLSRAAVSGELASGLLSAIEVTGLNLRRDIRLVLHKRKYMNHSLRSFLDSVRPG